MLLGPLRIKGEVMLDLVLKSNDKVVVESELIKKVKKKTYTLSLIVRIIST